MQLKTEIMFNKSRYQEITVKNHKEYSVEDAKPICVNSHVKDLSSSAFASCSKLKDNLLYLDRDNLWDFAGLLKTVP